MYYHSITWNQFEALLADAPSDQSIAWIATRDRWLNHKFGVTDVCYNTTNRRVICSFDDPRRLTLFILSCPDE